MLLNYTKKELDQLAKIYQVKGAYKLKKAELIETLIDLIPAHMDKALVNLSKEDLVAFEKVIEKGSLTDERELLLEYVNLIALGLIDFSEDEEKVIISVDERIKEAYLKLDRKTIKDKVQLNSQLRTHVMGLLNLYGVVEIEWALSLYNRDYETQLTREEFIEFIQKDDELASRLTVEEGYLADETVYAVDSNNLKAFILATKDKPYFIPAKEYIDKISDEDYYDNTLQVQALKAYLKKNFIEDEEVIEEAVLVVTMIARVDCSTNGSATHLMLEEWAAMGIEITHPIQQREAIEHIEMVANNTRKWINKGFTNDEIRPVSVKNQPIVKKLDVGRNAACPCGSGKKYKKCCGRNN
ncbi:hypothetical protein CS063_16865 [Sporanaerobium hydrogeniformans]|uniref:Uncharacterized protein n=1 Tax=Sporanaerobium hydrogeniformans TaxID=3072179 RepID=A0AC61D8Z0_9FIRM|nr:SEC-C metal-binding domain-containing protein [Sporanaerobium hydrogeniformans]PHV69235.1 hypothetical protein CS063_16865 [Sporanaerobium hydrogeniformans]